jgi:lipid-A-disaccharide synthase
MAEKLKVFIIAGEPSGDKLGRSLMDGLIELTDGRITFIGVGGEMMQGAGLAPLFDMSELSIMGLLEVVPSIPRIKRRIDQTAKAALEMRPDVFITIDSPDFCLRVGAKLKQAGFECPNIHYVAPSVWAWRPERATKMARTVDHVLALLPFEPPYMQAAGMSCDFVGHPITTELRPSTKDIQLVLADLGLTRDDEIISILPGSRRGEIKRLLPVYKEAVALIHAARPDAKFVLPAARPILADVKAQLADVDLPILLLDPSQFDAATAEHRKRAVYAASRAALATSGTISLDLARQRCPMVITYRANWLSVKIARRLWLNDRINLVNIVTDTYVVPELLAEDCTAQNAAKAVLDIIQNKDTRAAQIAACEETMAQLGEGAENPGLRAAKSVLDFIRKNR